MLQMPRGPWHVWVSIPVRLPEVPIRFRGTPSVLASCTAMHGRISMEPERPVGRPISLDAPSMRPLGEAH